jgi:hypothetical protein
MCHIRGNEFGLVSARESHAHIVQPHKLSPHNSKTAVLTKSTGSLQAAQIRDNVVKEAIGYPDIPCATILVDCDFSMLDVGVLLHLVSSQSERTISSKSWNGTLLSFHGKRIKVEHLQLEQFPDLYRFF